MSGEDSTARSGILSQGLISMLAYGVNVTVSFLAVFGMMRIMGSHSWGVFSLALQIVAFTSMLADFGISPVIMRRLAIAPERSASVLADATVTRLLLLVPAWILTIGIGLWLDPSWKFFVLVNVMLVNTIISSKLPVLRGSFDAYHRSQSRMGFPTMMMALDSVVLLLLVLLRPDLFHDPVTAMIVYTGSNTLGAIFLLIGTARHMRKVNTSPLRVSRDSIRELLGESWPLALFLLLNALHMSIDSIYLKIFHGEVAVGNFNAALRIMTPMGVYATIIAISMAPYFARASVEQNDEQRERTRRLFSLSIKTLLVGAVLLAVIGATNTRLVVDIALKGKFAGAYLPMVILFVAFIPKSVNVFLVEVNNARGQLARNTRLAAIMAVTSVVAGLLLIAPYGATGAAVGRSLAIMAGLVYTTMSIRQDIRMPMAGILLKSAGILVTFVALRWALDGLHPILSNLIAFTVAAAEVFAFRVFSASEMQQWKLQIASMLGRKQ